MTLKSLYCVLLVALTGVPVLEAKVQIFWTGEVTAGVSTTFTCSSSCFSDCIYTWFFKGRTINGSTLTWTPDGLEKTVKLGCTVLNAETGISSSTFSTVHVQNVPESQYLAADQWNVTITGPDTVIVGRMSQFICLANCTLNAECDISWQYEGLFPPSFYFSLNGSVIEWTPSEPNTVQNFTCIAKNKSGRSAEDTKIIQVKDPPTPAGVIPAIIVFYCVGGVTCAVLLYAFYIRQSSKRDTATRTGEGLDNAAYSPSQEVNYAENCFQNKDEGTVQHGLENNSTQYAAPTPPNYDAHIEEMKAELFDLVKAL